MTRARLQLLRAEAEADDRRITSEAELQRAVATLLDGLGLLWMHPANERKCSPAAGLRLKQAGVKAGVPDVLIFQPGRTCRALAIELKHGRRQPSPAQIAWHKRLRGCSWSVHVCCTVAEVLAVLEQCGYLEVEGGNA